MNRVLVIGPSHAGIFQGCVDNYFRHSSSPSFDVVGVHGCAFYSKNSIAYLKDKHIKFCNVEIGSIQCSWFSKIEGFYESNQTVDLSAYDAILLLDPLFLSAAFFRNQLVSKSYICSAVHPSLRNRLMNKYLDGFHVISRRQFLECYLSIRPQNLLMFEYIQSECLSDKAYLIPHVLPPVRFSECEYGLYNTGEQQLISDFALEKYKIKSLSMPDDAVVLTDTGAACLEGYHLPHPDVHHASPLYYKKILDSFLKGNRV